MKNKLIIPLGYSEFLEADLKEIVKSFVEGYGKDLMGKTTKRKKGITKLAFCVDCVDYKKCVWRLYRKMKPLYKLSKKQREGQKEVNNQILEIFGKCKYKKEVLRWFKEVKNGAYI